MIERLLALAVLVSALAGLWLWLEVRSPVARRVDPRATPPPPPQVVQVTTTPDPTPPQIVERVEIHHHHHVINPPVRPVADIIDGEIVHERLTDGRR